MTWQPTVYCQHCGEQPFDLDSFVLDEDPEERDPWCQDLLCSECDARTTVERHPQTGFVRIVREHQENRLRRTLKVVPGPVALTNLSARLFAVAARPGTTMFLPVHDPRPRRLSRWTFVFLRRLNERGLAGAPLEDGRRIDIPAHEELPF